MVAGTVLLLAGVGLAVYGFVPAGNSFSQFAVPTRVVIVGGVLLVIGGWMVYAIRKGNRQLEEARRELDRDKRRRRAESDLQPDRKFIREMRRRTPPHKLSPRLHNPPEFLYRHR